MQLVSLKQMKKIATSACDPGYTTLDVLNGRSGEGGWTYIGREMRYDDWTFEASPLGNPYRVGSKGRGTVIEPYRRWLWQQLQVPNSPHVQALRALTADSVLVCWCNQPGRCHGHVIADAWAYLQTPAGAWLAAENRVIVAGSRSYTDEVGLFQGVSAYLKTLTGSVALISGGAKGADALGEWYACYYGLPVTRMAANWEEDGKRAGFLRNERMAEVATHLIAFWDGRSPGTRHMIETARACGLPVHVEDVS